MDDSISIEDLLQQYDTQKQQKRGQSTAFLKKLLQQLRITQLRRPDVVLDNWKTVLRSESGNEVWSLYEQICIAALDVGDNALADECIAQLLLRFPDSVRAGRLIGLQKEQQGDYGDALEIYKNLLTKNPSNLLLLRRKVCVYKAMGDLKGEAEELNSLLKQFPADKSSWQELGELYLSLCDNEAAAHCFEELILLASGNAHYHVRLAEAYYSIGDYDRLLLARKHYAVSLTIQSSQHNLRGLYGLLYTCLSLTALPANKAIVSSGNNNSSDSSSSGNKNSSSSEHEERVTRELLLWAQQQLQQLAASEGAQSPLQLLLKALQL